MIISDAQYIKDQIRDNQNNLNALPTVATYHVKPIDTDKHGWKKHLASDLVKFYKTIGANINRQGFGNVIITPRILADALRYITNNGEAAAFYVAHKVIKQGIMIGYHINHKDRSLDTITFAAPVEINRKRANMAVVIKVAGRNIYKTHRILTPEGNLFLLEEF